MRARADPFAFVVDTGRAHEVLKVMMEQDWVALCGPEGQATPRARSRPLIRTRTDVAGELGVLVAHATLSGVPVRIYQRHVLDDDEVMRRVVWTEPDVPKVDRQRLRPQFGDPEPPAPRSRSRCGVARLALGRVALAGEVVVADEAVSLSIPVYGAPMPRNLPAQVAI